MADEQQREPDAPSAPGAPGAPGPLYRGEPLEAARGPGLGCFRFQIVLLVVSIVLTPVSVFAGWAEWVSVALLALTIVLLFFTGQTLIFLLRLVAADRRSRRRPLGAGARPTVGDLAERSGARSDEEDE